MCAEYTKGIKYTKDTKSIRNTTMSHSIIGTKTA